MKKLLLLPVILVITQLTGNAQKVQLGFTAGLSIANYQASSNNIDESSDPAAGFTTGVLARFELKKHLILQPEINWVQKGTIDKSTNGDISKISLTTNNIEIPVNLMYTTKNGFFVGGGPSFSVGISGNLKATGTGPNYDERIHFGNGDNDIMRAFDFGINALGGYKFRNGILVSANYNMGVINLSNGKGSGTEKLYSNYFGIRLGYLFKVK